MVRSAVLEHWLLDANGRVREEVKSKLQKEVQDSTANSQQEAVESRVRQAVNAVVNSNAPSKVACRSPVFLSHSPMSTPEMSAASNSLEVRWRSPLRAVGCMQILQVDASVTSTLQGIIRQRLSGVDWLLAINGAWVVQSSPSFDPCQGAAAESALCPSLSAINSFVRDARPHRGSHP